MKNYEALGVVETQYFTIAIELLDAICKSADVKFLTSENYLGGRLVTMVFGGTISNITVAMETARNVASEKMNNPLKMALVISNPHPEIMRYIVPSQLEEEKSIPIVKEKMKEKEKPKKSVKEKK
ncbi:BMC domain-containing protein [Bacillus sp. Bva_UNVM-123]|uniref:BMC domain-containing protein n=1 Tax=Bacillus sp. Bva_UNVM-123 TaxID=2829798 RepID=UPI00391F039B